MWLERTAKVMTSALPIILLLSGCGHEADPKSAEFAALCTGALSGYYVDGGMGPEYEAKSKRELYWRDRYFSIAGIHSDTTKKLIKIVYDLQYQHRHESTADRNVTFKRIMDR